MIIKKNFINNVINKYKKGKNISLYLKKKIPDLETKIEISYDLQSGSYNQIVKKNKKKYINLANEITSVIFENFKNFNSFLDCGCGELSFSKIILNTLKKKITNYYGFDISLKRIQTGIKNYNWNLTKNKLFVAKLDQIPLPNNSIDIVFTNHAIEPNRGNEIKILKELLRVARFGLVLNEPYYPSSNIFQKKRMDKMNYAKICVSTIKKLGFRYKILELENHISCDNKTKLIIFFKNKSNPVKFNLVDPKFKSVLSYKKTYLYSNETKYIFPIIDKIPILIDEKKILYT